MLGKLGPIAAATMIASVAFAATPDHLRCYKVKDSARGAYSADLTGLAPSTGCTIKLPGKLLCVEAEKTNVTPPSSIPGSGPAAGEFLCYKLKCPRGTAAPVDWVDQFGARTVTPIVSKLVCAPRLASTTSTTTSTTTTLVPNCTPGIEGQACGTCGTGLCGLHCGGTGLTCFSNGASSCDTSVACTSDTQCTGGKVCISSPGAACSEAFCCNPCS
jgi:hypothetical protein